jgi:hypothetical protein
MNDSQLEMQSQDNIRKSTTNDERVKRRANERTMDNATSFNSEKSGLGINTSQDNSKRAPHNKKLLNSKSYDLDEEIRGLPTELDKSNGPE